MKQRLCTNLFEYLKTSKTKVLHSSINIFCWFRLTDLVCFLVLGDSSRHIHVLLFLSCGCFCFRGNKRVGSRRSHPLRVCLCARESPRSRQGWMWPLWGLRVSASGPVNDPVRLRPKTLTSLDIVWTCGCPATNFATDDITNRCLSRFLSFSSSALSGLQLWLSGTVNQRNKSCYTAASSSTQFGWFGCLDFRIHSITFWH